MTTYTTLLDTAVRIEETGEVCHVILRDRNTGPKRFEVFVDGGVLCDGDDSARYDVLANAIAFHQEEVLNCLGL